ncbi:MAG TPA: hypothetical protein VK964_15415 [Nocardioidaceae bacterium]|nr:hypothetical protein [Nocardioidaceae bacterium]
MDLTPHGHRYRIDHHGTHPLGKIEVIRIGSTSMEIYEPDFAVTYAAGWQQRTPDRRGGVTSP